MFTGQININRKDVHASIISINGKYIKNMGVYHCFEKSENKTQGQHSHTCFVFADA